MAQFKIFTLPNFFTSANMACGCIGIQQLCEGNLQMACYCIYLAAFVDFLDGFVARLFNATSELGKQLDSLCDVVSFGVLPGFIMYSLLEEYKWMALLIPIFAALRLAKFNIDQRQSEEFIGVPTPITALFITGLAFAFQNKIDFKELNYMLLFFTILSSLLMVVELPLLSLKFKGFDFRPNVFRYLLLFASVVFILLLAWQSFIFIYLFYILLSVVKNKITNQSL
jgi:CDP-diacylglycerol--serine O-phosphatidyltransferase